MATQEELRQQEYTLQVQINRLQQQLNATTAAKQVDALLLQIADLQEQLYTAQHAQIAQITASSKGVLLHSKSAATSKGPVAGLSAAADETTVTLKMAYVPTATYHLFNRDDHPLIVCQLKAGNAPRRVRITSFIEGYTAMAVDTVEIAAKGSALPIQQLPTLFPDRIATLTELTRATLNIKVEELDGNRVDLHKTEPLWLLSRNSAALEVRDPSTGAQVDLSRYLGAYVAPNAPTVMDFLPTAARHHPNGRLEGYQQDVPSQVQAIYDALREDAKIAYINSIINFNPEQSATTQRVRLPSESLKGAANCIDGVLLFASLLEAISLNPAIVIIPGHAIVGWEVPEKSDQWQYLETTMIGTNPFTDALDIGNRKAKTFSALATKDPSAFRRWSLKELRSKFGITPLE